MQPSYRLAETVRVELTHHVLGDYWLFSKQLPYQLGLCFLYGNLFNYFSKVYPETTLWIFRCDLTSVGCEGIEPPVKLII